MAGRVVEECAQLMGGPRLRDAAAQRSPARRERDRRGIRDDQAAARGVAERSAEHLVDLDDGLLVQSAGTDVVAGDGQVGVHALDVVRS